MTSITIGAITALVLTALQIVPVHAASPEADTLDAFGFFGTWSLHCDRPAGPANIQRRAYISASGEAGFSESLGPDIAENTYRVLAASVSGRIVVLDIELNGMIRQKLTMQRDGARIRTLANELPDGRTLVRDGTIVTTGGKTPWLNRCDDPR